MSRKALTHIAIAVPRGLLHTVFEASVFELQRALELNNKTDGVADDLLPNTTLQFALRASKRDDSRAFFGALPLSRLRVALRLDGGRHLVLELGHLHAQLLVLRERLLQRRGWL